MSNTEQMQGKRKKKIETEKKKKYYNMVYHVKH